MQTLFISGAEIFIIMLIALLLFGSKRIPEIARGLGKGMKEFKSVTADIKKEINTVKEPIMNQGADLTDNINQVTPPPKKNTIEESDASIEVGSFTRKKPEASKDEDNSPDK